MKEHEDSVAVEVVDAAPTPEVMLPEPGDGKRVEEFGIARIGD